MDKVAPPLDIRKPSMALKAHEIFVATPSEL